MHRYYAHALGQVFAHVPRYGLYLVRHPFPPYATQYISLLALFHFFSYDLAEKIFTCIEVLCFAFGLRGCATAIGPAGGWVSLLLGPLLLPWYLLMGFFNYGIGIGVALCTLAFWLRLDRTPWALSGFLVGATVLIFSHPVPFLLLLVFLVADLLRRRFLSDGSTTPADSSLPQAGWLRIRRVHVFAFFYTALIALYPSLAVDKTQAASTLSDAGFHLPFLRTALLLTGLSPYNTRSHNLLVNGYRAALYLLLILSLVWGWKAFRARQGEPGFSLAQSFFVYGLAFALFLPFCPDHLNGGVFFATRMVIMVWVFLLLSASGMASPTRRLRYACIGLGGLFTLATLLPAEHTLRPLARELRVVEQAALPAHVNAIVVDGPVLVLMSRSRYDLAFDPFLWGNMLPLVREDALVLNAPWLQLSISPLRAAPGGPAWADASALTGVPQVDPPVPLVNLVPSTLVEDTVQRTKLVLYAGSSEELAGGLAPFLGEKDAALFHCHTVVSWSIACVRD